MNHKNALPGRRTCEPAARLITSGRSPKGQPTGSNARHDGRLPQQLMNRVGQTAPSARARSVQTARGATVPRFPLTARPKTVFDLVLLADRLGQVECPTGLEANEVFRSPRRSWRASARTFKIVITLEAASPIDFPHGRDVLFRCHRSPGRSSALWFGFSKRPACRCWMLLYYVDVYGFRASRPRVIMQRLVCTLLLLRRTLHVEQAIDIDQPTR